MFDRALDFLDTTITALHSDDARGVIVRVAASLLLLILLHGLQHSLHCWESWACCSSFDERRRRTKTCSVRMPVFSFEDEDEFLSIYSYICSAQMFLGYSEALRSVFVICSIVFCFFWEHCFVALRPC